MSITLYNRTARISYFVIFWKDVEKASFRFRIASEVLVCVIINEVFVEQATCI